MVAFIEIVLSVELAADMRVERSQKEIPNSITLSVDSRRSLHARNSKKKGNPTDHCLQFPSDNFFMAVPVLFQILVNMTPFSRRPPKSQHPSESIPLRDKPKRVFGFYFSEWVMGQNLHEQSEVQIAPEKPLFLKKRSHPENFSHSEQTLFPLTQYSSAYQLTRFRRQHKLSS